MKTFLTARQVATAASRAARRGAAFLLAPLLAMMLCGALTAGTAAAKQRHALVVGVSDYGKTNGLAKLNAPADDAKMVKLHLERLRHRFAVDILTNDEAKDKETFNATLQRFLERVQPGDEVLFYFSGHGYNIPPSQAGARAPGNYYLLPSAKGRDAYLKSLSAADLRALDTEEKKDRSYAEWIATVALSEKDIENAIRARNPEVIVLIADACRSLIEGAKGVSLVSGVTLPSDRAQGIFRLYSASMGQVSLDSPDPIDFIDSTAKSPEGGKQGAKKEKRTNSLFTRVLLAAIGEPGLEISIMAAKVKVAVRQQALDLGRTQIPDFSEDRESRGFYFTPADAPSELVPICQTAGAELAQLRHGVAFGSLGRKTLMDKFTELARCSKEIEEELRRLLRMEAQGMGALASAATQQLEAADPGDPVRFCDVNASSPLDPNRAQGVAGVDLQRIALTVNAGEGSPEAGERSLREIVKACEAAVAQRPLVARYKFNAGRAYSALALMTNEDERLNNLARASAYYQMAVDLGYAAAYNDLALMHKNGEYYAIRGNSAALQPADREKAADLLRRGAELNHTVAQYNLGMAYKDGDLGLKVNNEDNRLAFAFQYLGPSAERGYVPAMIEAGKALHDGRGVPDNPDRAVELLEISASRGSWEAMYWLGEIYRRGKVPDEARAIIWHARAAEAGFTESQEILAGMLTKGQGVPAPQRETAGRYWRLAADAGSMTAMMELANLLRDGRIPFRPVINGRPDGGALEIRNLYSTAFARGNPGAGLELAKLYRTGFPKGSGSQAIPKDGGQSAALLWDTINKVKQADRDSAEADPSIEYLAAFQLLGMHEAGDGRRPDGTLALTEDQVAQLKASYGDGSKAYWVRVSAMGPVRCGEDITSIQPWVLVWDWTRDEPPTEPQFQWWERHHKCAEKERNRAKKFGRKEPAATEIGFTKQLRDIIAREYKQARNDAAKKGGKTFRERIVELVNKQAAKGK